MGHAPRRLGGAPASPSTTLVSLDQYRLRFKQEQHLKLLIKFNILLVGVFALGLISTYFEARTFLQRQAEGAVLREAGLIATSATATRIYTEEAVTPYLAKAGEADGVFLPQTIPFSATTTIFQKIQHDYPDYTYKEAALNPTNLRDRATDWEADLIQHFRNSPNDQELIRTRDSATGPSLYLAHPIRVEPGCLQCHSEAAKAPKTMVAHYGDRNGFGWTNGEIVGAQIISVPKSLPLQIAHDGLTELTIGLCLIFLVVILLIDLGLYFIVIRPLRTISDSANRISQGEMHLDPLRIHGRDEVAEVTRSFNRMHTSLKKAMDLLEEQ
jgi:protein-histidine pros-kinase